MKSHIALSTVSISPHLTPVFEAFAKLRPFKYFYHYEKHDEQRATCGWTNESTLCTELVEEGRNEELENTPVLIESMRDIDLIERRLEKGLLTIYMSERWLKPFSLTLFGIYITLPGILRILSPRYRRMARRFVNCLKNPHCYYLAQGVWAARDMSRLCGLFSGKIGCLIKSPQLQFEKPPCGRILSSKEHCYCCEKIRLWGYFVAPSKSPKHPKNEGAQSSISTETVNAHARVLWVGRMLNWKRLETLVRAARYFPNIHFTVVGEGPEETRLKRLASGFQNITFLKYQKAECVREMMRKNDVYVLTSNSCEGWGAVLSEALEEGMCVYGTREAGSSATILNESHLYHAGNVAELIALLERPIEKCVIGEWSGHRAAKRLDEFLSEVLHDTGR